MINPQILAQAEIYLERHCLDKNWFDYRVRIGKPVDLHRLKIFKDFVERFERKEKYTSENDAIVVKQVKDRIRFVQNHEILAPLGDDPQPITDDERARTLDTQRSYFANYLFDIMAQKKLREADVAARAHVDVAIFSRLRKNKRYVPEERTVFALLFGLELNLAEANSLMHRVKVYLSANVREEVIIGFCLENCIYDLATLNEILKHYELAPLKVTEDFSERPGDKPFHDEGLLEQIDLYLEKNFHEVSPRWVINRRLKFSYSAKRSPLGYPPESAKTFEVIIRKLKDKIGLAGSFFSDYLFKLIKQKNLSEVAVYKAAHLDRRVFSKIRNERNYMPAKKTVMAIAFAMKLDFKETNTLLACAGYFLSSGRKEDVIVTYFIENQIYDLFLINEVLDYYGCPTLGD